MGKEVASLHGRFWTQYEQLMFQIHVLPLRVNSSNSIHKIFTNSIYEDDIAFYMEKCVKITIAPLKKK